MADQRGGHCYQEHVATHLIFRSFKGRERSQALALYYAQAYHASREFRSGGREGAIASRNLLSELSGLSHPIVRKLLARFVEIGLVEEDRLKDAQGRDMASAWHLVTPETQRTGGSQQSAPRGDESGAKTHPHARASEIRLQEEETPLPNGRLPQAEQTALSLELQEMKAPDLVEVIFERWRTTVPGRSGCRLTKPRRQKITARLTEKSGEDLLRVVDFIAQDEWSNGKNDRNRPFNDFETIFRSEEKVDDLLAAAAGGKSDKARRQDELREKYQGVW